MITKFYKSTNFIDTIIALGLLIPNFTYAQFLFGSADTTFSDIIWQVLGIIYTLIPILFALAFLVFFWGLSKFILHSGNEADVTKGKNYMLWGILALFLLVSSMAIVTFLTGELGFRTDALPLLPE